MAKRIQSWEVSDVFWERVHQMIPQSEQDSGRNYKRIAGSGRKPIPCRRVFEGIVFYNHIASHSILQMIIPPSLPVGVMDFDYQWNP